jgi:hypothetical protein
MPKRIQRKRTRGWKMPPNTVYVGRPTPYGNPYVVGGKGGNTFAPVPDDAAMATRWFRESSEKLFKRYPEAFSALRGKNLACWCALDQPCHADVLLDDDPLRLSDAVAIAFPQGGMTVSGLRREAAAGRLMIERIAGKDFTTLAAIERMRELCRVKAKARASGSSQPEGEATESSGRFGSSATAQPSEALALARASLQRLKRPSPTTSSPSPRSRASATVTRLKSGSPT